MSSTSLRTGILVEGPWSSLVLSRYRDILPYKWRTVKIPVEEPKPGENHNKYVAISGHTSDNSDSSDSITTTSS